CSRSDAEWKSVRKPAGSSAAQPDPAATSIATRSHLRIALVLHRDPLQVALRLDARLQDTRRGGVDALEDAAVDRMEALVALTDRLDESEHVALMQRAHAKRHAAREDVHGGERAVSREREGTLRRDLVVDREDVVSRPQAVHELDELQALLGLHEAAR